MTTTTAPVPCPRRRRRFSVAGSRFPERPQPTGQSHRPPDPVYLAPMPNPNTRCLLLLVDGLRPDMAEARLAAGELPHLADDAPERRAYPRHHRIPLHHQRRLSALSHRLHARPLQHPLDPLARPPARTAAAGGASARRCAAIAGIRRPGWTTTSRPTCAPSSSWCPRASGIFTPVARGLTAERDPSRGERQFWGALAHYAQWHQPSDDAVARHLLRAVDGPARFVFAQFPAVDGYTHQTDPDAEPVRRALRKVDAAVGAVRERLRSARRAGRRP